MCTGESLITTINSAEFDSITRSNSDTAKRTRVNIKRNLLNDVSTDKLRKQNKNCGTLITTK